MRIFDLHNDILTAKKVKTGAWLEDSNKVGAAGVVCAIYTTEMKNDMTIWNTVDKFFNVRKAFEDAGSSFDLRLSFEDLWFLKEENFLSLILARPVMCGLTWNKDNRLGGGALDHGGLTEFGEQVIRKLEEEHILIDTAHLNERTFFDVARVSHGTIICSHTAFYACMPHPRNLKDFQIRMILESGGVVGLTMVSDFLAGGKYSGIDDVVNHIMHFVNTFGSVDGLAIGTDFWGTKQLPKGLNWYDGFAKLEEKLLEFGFTNDDIEKLFFLNAKRVLDRK